MAIQINVPLTAKTGQAVPSGSYCVLHITLTLRKRIDIEMRTFVSKANFDNLDDPFSAKEIPLSSYSQQLTDQQYADITNISIHNFVKAYLEGLPAIGVGNTQLVN